MRRALALLVLAMTAAAGSAQESCPLREAASDVEVLPIAFGTYGDAYDSPGPAHPVNTTYPCPPSPVCPAGTTTVHRAAYVGSTAGPGFTAPSRVRDLVALFVFDACDINGKARCLKLRLRNMQNFTGLPYHLSVKVLENAGTIGGKGLFRGIGPLGIPPAGAMDTALADGRSDRGELHVGDCTIPARGPLVARESCAGGVPWLTFDRSADLVLSSGFEDPGSRRQLRWSIRKACELCSATFTTCRTSCEGTPTIRNADCDLSISNPIYVAVSAVVGSEGASARLQDSLAVDNIVHLMGNPDFAGPDPSLAPRVSFVWSNSAAACGPPTECGD